MAGREHLLKKWTKDHLAGQLLRYLLVAGAGYLFALAVYASALNVGINPYAAVAITFALNGLFNFVGFRIWTFQPSGRRPTGELARFCVVASGSLLVNYASFAIFYELVELPALLAQAMAIAVAAPFGFVANRQWTFRAEPAAGGVDVTPTH
jgi:putative flippase GtrA